VVVEADSGRDVGATGPVEVDLDVDLRLLGLAVEGGASAPRDTSFFWAVTDVRASRNAAISAGVPIETRSQPSGPISRIRTPRSSRPRQAACRSGKVPKSTKFASLSATVNPWARSHSTVSSRSTRSRSTALRSSSA
jgi:hypothetical protein